MRSALEALKLPTEEQDGLSMDPDVKKEAQRMKLRCQEYVCQVRIYSGFKNLSTPKYGTEY